MTWYKIYRTLCTELNIMFPLKQSEICLRRNPIPDNLEFYLKNSSKNDIDKARDLMSEIYYSLMSTYGHKKMCQVNDRFIYKCDKFTERTVSINTVISVLLLSGFKKDAISEKLQIYFEEF